jgi:addiction module RelE/StbE family toxin
MLHHSIEFTHGFLKQFKALHPKQKERFYSRLDLFKKNPHDKSLRDHALKGKYAGYRSIDIAGDLRALYYVNGSTIVIFAYVWTHSQLY